MPQSFGFGCRWSLRVGTASHMDAVREDAPAPGMQAAPGCGRPPAPGTRGYGKVKDADRIHWRPVGRPITARSHRTGGPGSCGASRYERTVPRDRGRAADALRFRRDRFATTPRRRCNQGLATARRGLWFRPGPADPREASITSRMRPRPRLGSHADGDHWRHGQCFLKWLQEPDSHQRSPGYEPGEMATSLSCAFINISISVHVN